MKMRAPYVIWVGAAAAIAAVGCDKNKGSVPATPEARLEALAAHMPPQTAAALFVTDLEEMRASIDRATGAIGEALPALAAGRQQITDQLGADPLDPAAWEKAGLAKKGAFAVGLIAGRPVLLTYVDDPARFNAALTDRAPSAFGVEGAASAKKIDGIKVRSIGPESGALSWAYDGKLAVIVPPSEKPGSGAALAALMKTKAEASAATTPSFQAFREGLGSDYAFAAWADTARLLEAESVKESFAAGGPNESSVAWLKEHVSQMSARGSAKGDEIKVAATLGADAETIAKVKEFGAPPAPAAWDTLVTDDVFVGVRGALDPAKAWPYYKSTLPDQARIQITGAFESAATQLGVDVERDIIANLNGNVGIFIYGLNPGKLMLASRNPAMLPLALKLAVVADFKDEAQITALVDKIKASPIDDSLKPVAPSIGGEPVEGFSMIGSPGGGAAIYFFKNRVVIATDELGAEDLYARLGGEARAKPLSAVGGALGKEFGSVAPFNGIYLNFDRIAAFANSLGASNFIKGLDSIKEATIRFDADKRGLHAIARVSLNPPAASGSAADALPTPSAPAPAAADPTTK